MAKTTTHSQQEAAKGNEEARRSGRPPHAANEVSEVRWVIVRRNLEPYRVYSMNMAQVIAGGAQRQNEPTEAVCRAGRTPYTTSSIRFSYYYNHNM
ncbi:hypothetical protein [Vibrio parahaemolyticus]|uniref:hypothetical protein n=1 Tax=Vibrio parahaemolyticus TaxID=670 RepID=UPI001037300A|nr:hypothetical protein [Vibrio parahaemolyticus]MBE3687211.1 hypothetical protein [Vibrio parahaemolyticus]MBE3803984.1 hypothetical protein [Vibrio parahaemolyticus]MCZ6418291.1 hypothetical protein [Vibrio parahaemolyticus]MDF4355659.1 hypothetical protein [Vibrio parahaemolyticus]MDF4542447.1 hypothetical protein [Vibrio parahaemolyticus]